MVLLWRQRTFVTVHNVALKQKLPKLRLFHLEHFAQLAKAQRLMHINKAIKEFCLWGRQRQLLFRRTALLKLFCQGTCRFRRISEIGQMGEFSRSCQRSSSSAVKPGKDEQPPAASHVYSAETLTCLTFMLVMIHRDRLGKALRGFRL